MEYFYERLDHLKKQLHGDTKMVKNDDLLKILFKLFNKFGDEWRVVKGKCVLTIYRFHFTNFIASIGPQRFSKPFRSGNAKKISRVTYLYSEIEINRLGYSNLKIFGRVPVVVSLVK